jgi:hypothetical protein
MNNSTTSTTDPPPKCASRPVSTAVTQARMAYTPAQPRRRPVRPPRRTNRRDQRTGTASRSNLASWFGVNNVSLISSNESRCRPLRRCLWGIWRRSPSFMPRSPFSGGRRGGSRGVVHP